MITNIEPQNLFISQNLPKFLPTIRVRIVPNSDLSLKSLFNTPPSTSIKKSIHHPEIGSKKPNFAYSIESTSILQRSEKDYQTKRLTKVFNYASHSQNLKKFSLMLNPYMSRAELRIFGSLLKKNVGRSIFSLSLNYKLGNELDDNIIECINNGIAQLRELRTLRISIILITVRNEKFLLGIAKNLKKFLKLQNLALELSPITSKICTELAKSISRLEELKSLRFVFSSQNISILTFDILANSIFGKKDLESVDLELVKSNFINPFHNELKKALHSLTKLKVFKFSCQNVTMSDEAFISIFEELENVKNLETVHVNFEFNLKESLTNLYECLQKSVSKLKNLKEFHMNFEKSRDIGMELSKLVSEVKSIQSFKLKIPRFSNYEQCDKLFTSLGELNNLQTLIIECLKNDLTISKEHVRLLANSIKQLSQLRRLEINFEKEIFEIQRKEIEELLYSISNLKKLASLKLSLLVPPGAEQSFKNLSNLLELRSIDISFYGLIPKEFIGEKLISTLILMKNLTTLQLFIGRDPLINPQTLEDFLENFAKMEGLKKLSLMLDASIKFEPEIANVFRKFIRNWGLRELEVKFRNIAVQRSSDVVRIIQDESDKHWASLFEKYLI